MSPTAVGFERAFTSLMVVCGIVYAIVVVVTVLLVIRYHHRRVGRRERPIVNPVRWEIAWTAATMLFFTWLFVIGARHYRDFDAPEWAGEPSETHDVLVTGKRWMWRFEHPSGVRELGELHVPIGQPVRLYMSSEDVIHSFFIPDFRVKWDVLPNRTTSVWFEATEPGIHPIRCAEYCGHDHSRMEAKLIALEPAEFARWQAELTQSTTLTSAPAGEHLFHRYQCHTCHTNGEAPPLGGIRGREIRLADGSSRIADEAYLRESILTPASQVVAGYPAAMPAYVGRLTEPELTQLVLYLETLPAEERVHE
jgi:cytochrome c oxidase subunit 2